MKKETFSFAEVESLLYKAAHAERREMSKTMQARLAVALSAEERRIARLRYVRRMSKVAAVLVFVLGILWWQLPSKPTPMNQMQNNTVKPVVAVTIRGSSVWSDLQSMPGGEGYYYPLPQRYFVSNRGKRRSVMCPGGLNVEIYSVDL